MVNNRLPASGGHNPTFLALEPPATRPTAPPARRPRGRRSWRAVQRDLALLTGGELHGLVVDQDLDRLGRAGARAEPHVVLGQLDVDPMPAVVDAELEVLDLRWQGRLEPEHWPAGPHAGQAAQHDVDGAGHRAQVDALGGGAALDV